MGLGISLLCELMKCGEGPSLQGEQAILPAAESPSHSHRDGSLFLGENWGYWAAFGSPPLHHLIARSLEKQGSGGNGMEPERAFHPTALLGDVCGQCPVHTLATGTRSGPEFALVRICRASPSQGVQQLLLLMAQLPS